VALRTNKFLLLVGGWELARGPAVATASSWLSVMNQGRVWALTSNEAALGGR